MSERQGESGNVAANGDVAAHRPPVRVSADAAGLRAQVDPAQAARVGERLAAELRAAIDLLPPQARRPVGVSRELGIDRGTAARAVRTARRAGASSALEALLHAPGVEGLHKIIDAGRDRNLPEQTIAALERAVNAYAELIGSAGGSQAQLNARLNHLRKTGRSEGAGATDERRRKRLHEVAASIVGRSCEVRTEVILTRFAPERAGELERFWARGVIGYQGEPDAMPLVIGAAESSMSAEEAEHAAPAPINASVAVPFTSAPPPVVTRRGPGNQAILAIDPAAAANHERADVVLKSAQPDRVADAAGPIETDEIRTIMRNPAQALIFDVYVHSDLIGERIPSAGVYLWSPAAHQSLADRWYDRLPHPPVLQLLGRGLGNAGEDAYDRQAELAAFCFKEAGWDADEFAGFRFAVRYPVWGGCYCMGFRYGDD